MEIYQLLSTFIYAFFFIILLVWLFIKHKNGIAKYITIIWVVSTISAFFFQFIIGNVYNKISFVPYFFIIICFLLSIYPIIKNGNISERIDSTQSTKILSYVMWFFIIISIIPFIENLFQVLKSVNTSNNEIIADIYDSKMYGGGLKITWLSPIGKLFNSVIGIFIQFLFFVPFYLLTESKLKKKFFQLMFLPLANHLLFQIAVAGRGTVVLFILNAIFFLILFNKIIPRERLKIIYIFFLSLIFLLISALTIITFARKEATNAGDETIVFIGYYIAKSHLDFNNNLWHINVYTEGDNTCAFFKNLIGLETFKSFLKKEAFWESQIGVQPGYFYTYIGDFYMDFGPFLTLAIFFLIFLIAILYFSSSKKMSTMKLFLFFLYCEILIMGWSINYFKTYDSMRNLIASTILLYITITFSSRRKLNLPY